MSEVTWGKHAAHSSARSEYYYLPLTDKELELCFSYCDGPRRHLGSCRNADSEAVGRARGAEVLHF